MQGGGIKQEQHIQTKLANLQKSIFDHNWREATSRQSLEEARNEGLVRPIVTALSDEKVRSLFNPPQRDEQPPQRQRIQQRDLDAQVQNNNNMGDVFDDNNDSGYVSDNSDLFTDPPTPPESPPSSIPHDTGTLQPDTPRTKARQKVVQINDSVDFNNALKRVNSELDSIAKAWKSHLQLERKRQNISSPKFIEMVNKSKRTTLDGMLDQRIGTPLDAVHSYLDNHGQQIDKRSLAKYNRVRERIEKAMRPIDTPKKNLNKIGFGHNHLYITGKNPSKHTYKAVPLSHQALGFGCLELPVSDMNRGIVMAKNREGHTVFSTTLPTPDAASLRKLLCHNYDQRARYSPLAIHAFSQLVNHSGLPVNRSARKYTLMHQHGRGTVIVSSVADAPHKLKTIMGSIQAGNTSHQLKSQGMQLIDMMQKHNVVNGREANVLRKQLL